MWTPVKIAVEHLRAEYFAPYGHLIHEPKERMPDRVKGDISSYEKQAFANVDGAADGAGWYAENEKRTPLSEGYDRAHFAFHTDAGQSFFPVNGRPSMYIVGGVGQPLRPAEMRCFYGVGMVGVCLHLGVWHSMPICVEGEELYVTYRGTADYQEHSVEVEFDLQQGLVISPDWANFDPAS